MPAVHTKTVISKLNISCCIGVWLVHRVVLVSGWWILLYWYLAGAYCCIGVWLLYLVVLVYG